MRSRILDLIQKELRDALDLRRVVVIYDPEGALSTVFDAFEEPGVAKVDARRSMFAARRMADERWGALTHPDVDQRDCKGLLIYVPWPRGQRDEERQREPFEPYALLGRSFGDGQAHALDSFARRAIPERAAEIDRLFAERRKPTLEQLEALGEQRGYPMLKQALGTEDPTDVGAQLIATPSLFERHRSAAGVESDLFRLLGEAFGFDAAGAKADLSSAFARWALFSEFAFDVDDRVPESVRAVPRAGARHKEAVYRLCDRLRGMEESREAYFAAAEKVERALGLGSLAEDVSPWGRRDTFASEDVASLRFVVSECMAGRLSSARETLDLRKKSIWLHQTERNERWQLATRCLELLEAEQTWRARSPTTAASAEKLVHSYTAAEGGLWRVDRCYRWMERAESSCADKALLEPLVRHTRAVYRGAVDGAQTVFLEVVARDGWPAGPLPQVQVFARQVAPLVEAGGRVAYFLVDALRFEMGRDLGQMLEKLGSVRVDAASSVVPATTPFGMAALLPGAEAGLGCVIDRGELVPSLGGKRTAGVDDRTARFRERFGDRFVDLRLDDLLEASDAELRRRLGKATLLVIRSEDIDNVGERLNAPVARRLLSSILDDLLAVTQRLVRAGVLRLVFAADHGFMMLREVPAGDKVTEPAGEWVLRKRRSRVGTAAAVSAEGVRILPATALGLNGPVKDVALATGFRVFTEGATYFHEGVSLQECVVPVVTLEAKPVATTAGAGPAHVEILAKRDQIHSRAFGVKLKLSSLLESTMDVRVVVMTARSRRPVGKATDCDALDPATGLVRLQVGVEEHVSLRIDEDFEDSAVEIQVRDAGGAGVLLGSKKLKKVFLE
ncbi:MAG: PglZ domain-containing protein [Polyangiaceae bacterium]